MSAWWLISFIILERGIELLWSSRNRQIVLSRGGREFYPETYPKIVILHAFFLIALIIESFPWQLALSPAKLGLITIFLTLQLFRYWCLVSLGEYWNTRILLIPGEKVVRKGPYRYLRHPNYSVVIIEFILIPLILETPVTLIVFFCVNFLVLKQRVRLEEKVLTDFTNYGDFEKMPKDCDKLKE
jgi:methyltransferase